MNTKSVIIIGAGIGGMSVGAFLSKAGYRVTVLEKNRIYGGYCQAFKRDGFLINPAVLRVGTKDCADRIDGYCMQLGIPKQEWNPYSESYQFGTDIHINMDNEDLAEELSKNFPEEKKELQDFFEEMYDVFIILNKVMRNDMKMSILSQEEIKKYVPYLSKKAIDIISTYFPDNKILQDILLAMMDISPNSVALSIPVTFFALKGNGKAFIMNGGIWFIIKELKGVIEENNGQVLCNKKVTKIILENNKAVGVESDGKKLYADIVISSIDLRKTYSKLLDSSVIDDQKMINKILHKWKSSQSCLSFWVGLDCTLEELGMEAESVILYRDKSHIVEVRSQMKDEKEMLPENFWFQVFSAYSSDRQCTPKGKAQLSIGLVVPYGMENTWGKDIGQEQEVKEKVIKMMLMQLEEFYPQLKGHYTFIESATPLTYERYTDNYQGSYLGFEKYSDFIYDKNKPENIGLVENLYQCSQWTSVIGGCIGIFQEAIKTANFIMNKYPTGSTKVQEYDLLV